MAKAVKRPIIIESESEDSDSDQVAKKAQLKSD